MLTKETTVTLIHAFISSRLDYCNRLLYGISSTLLRRLQSIQNAAERLGHRSQLRSSIVSHQCYENFTGCRSASVSRISSHSWSTSACTMLHQSTSAATVYRYHRWPGDDNCVSLSVAPWTVSGPRTVLDRRAFRVCGPATWNALPTELRRPTATVCPDTLGKKLKTCLFESSYWERIRWHWLFILHYTNARINWLIYTVCHIMLENRGK